MASADGSAGLWHQRKFPRSLPVFCAPRVPVLVRMSALGQKPTGAAQKAMSALPPKADMCAATKDVCFGPIADILRRENYVRFTPKPDISCDNKRNVGSGSKADIRHKASQLTPG